MSSDRADPGGYTFPPFVPTAAAGWDGMVAGMPAGVYSEAHKQHGPAFYQRVHGTEGTSTMQWEIGKSPTGETPVSFYMNHTRKEAGTTGGISLRQLQITHKL